ncbi:hypothetical protein [Dyella sp. 20L07]|uniref:hypothetical protein n=1 Tax=Dyella sp. 20L07 TaxID=3384240 RepID=UPI003D28EF4A
MRMWLALGLLVWATWAHADQPVSASSSSPPIQVRVHQDPVGTLMEGETARIKVDLLTPDFFIDAPIFPELHVDGAYLSLSDETPAHLVDTVDGATWSGVSRTYLITPLVSGTLEIPSFDITAHVGANRTPVIAHAPPLTLKVRALVLPQGVTEALIASSVKVVQTVVPENAGLHVGDTITRRIEITAQGSPAMMLPPTTFKAIDGLALYEAPPVTRDIVGNQGGFVGGSRVDAASYVIERRGRYTLPAITVRWMDSDTHTWRQSDVPAVHFHAWWGTPDKPRFSLPQQGAMPRMLAWFSSDMGIAVLMLIGLGWVAWWCRDWLARQLARAKAWRQRREHSEPAAFAVVKRLRRTRSGALLVASIDHWIVRSSEDGGLPTMHGWCATYGTSSLRESWDALQGELYGEVASTWSASGIVDELVLARKRWKRSQRKKHRSIVLPPLNPV